jgi:hypothetical protein
LIEQSAAILTPAAKPNGSLPANSPEVLPGGGTAAFQIPAWSGSVAATSCCASAERNPSPPAAWGGAASAHATTAAAVRHTMRSWRALIMSYAKG